MREKKHVHDAGCRKARKPKKVVQVNVVARLNLHNFHVVASCRRLEEYTTQRKLAEMLFRLSGEPRLRMPNPYSRARRQTTQ